MKTATAFAILLCATIRFCAPQPLVKPQRFPLFGKEYVRLDEWARANSFQWKWLSKNDVTVWNTTTKMQFTAESRKMSLNGVSIVLSEAVRNQNGVPLIANIDLSTAIQPILFIPKGRPRATVKHICIDPGHGGRDPGYRQRGEQEKAYTLLLAQELGTQLRKAGYTVSFTRTSDIFVDLPVRTDIARRRGADLFISLHFNSAGFGSSEVRGVEVYCMTPQRASSTNARGEGGNTAAYPGNLNNARNLLLAYEIQKAVTQGAAMEDRGVKRARFEVLRGAEMPAVLIESGFMSNPAEARNIFSTSWRRQMAQAIANGISKYIRTVQP
jgi:N-acetylmuramoyl-L-alanine amidase